MEQQVETQEQTTPAEAAPSSSGGFAVPQEYADRGWTKDVKSPDDLWKLTDNAQSLIGKRPAGIPTADAPQDEWDKFYQAAGRPDDSAGYEFAPIENLPEGADFSGYQEQAGGIFHEAGLTQKQADIVWKKYIALELGTSQEQQTQLDAQFDEITQKHFGDTFEQDQKIAMDMAAKVVPEELRAGFESLGNNPQALAAIVALAKGAQAEIDAVKQKYGAEGKLTSGEQTAGNSVGDVRKELAQLRTSEAARSFDHPNHAATLEKINALSSEVQRMLK